MKNKIMKKVFILFVMLFMLSCTEEPEVTVPEMVCFNLNVGLFINDKIASEMKGVRCVSENNTMTINSKLNFTDDGYKTSISISAEK